ncbi:MAG: HAD hydrolase-like protein [Clostridiales bacterium]|nr:HAD hydrolase-like protein [Clostridiales bacterium]
MALKKYRYIFWDMDGTIVNTYEGVSKCVQYALEPYGVQIEGEENIRRFIGPPLRDSFRRYAGIPQEQVEEVVARFRERYNPIGVFECELFPGVREAMQRFREAGLVQVLTSSKIEERCRDILEKFKLTGYLDEIVGASPDGKIDSKIEVLQEAFRRLALSYPETGGSDCANSEKGKIGILDCPDCRGFRKEDTVLIGDTKYDADGAREAGIDCVGVSYGFGTREELMRHGALEVYDDLQVLAYILTKL